MISHIVKQVLAKDSSYEKILAATTAFGKDVIPRVGGLIDVQPISDVIQILVRH